MHYLQFYAATPRGGGTSRKPSTWNKTTAHKCPGFSTTIARTLVFQGVWHANLIVQFSPAYDCLVPASVGLIQDDWWNRDGC